MYRYTYHTLRRINPIKKKKEETNNELTGATPSSSEIKYRWQRIIYSLNLKKKNCKQNKYFFKVPKKQNTKNEYITSIPLTLPSELLNSSPDSMTRTFDGPEISNNNH